MCHNIFFVNFLFNAVQHAAAEHSRSHADLGEVFGAPDDEALAEAHAGLVGLVSGEPAQQLYEKIISSPLEHQRAVEMSLGVGSLNPPQGLQEHARPREQREQWFLVSRSQGSYVEPARGLAPQGEPTKEVYGGEQSIGKPRERSGSALQICHRRHG